MLHLTKHILLRESFEHLITLNTQMLNRAISNSSHSQLLHRIQHSNAEKKYEQALLLFTEYRATNHRQIPSMLITEALRACTQLRNVRYAKELQLAIASLVDEDSYVHNAFLQFYMTCGDVQSAQLLFQDSKIKSKFSYATMMKGFIVNNQPSKAIDLFRQIKKPDEVIFIFLFNACAQLRTPDALVLVKEVWSDVLRSTTTNPRLLTSLVDALAKCGDLDTAADVFNRCPSKSKEIYGAIMKGCIINNQPSKAIDLFRQIKKPDEVIFILLFNACAQLKTSGALALVKQVWSDVSRSTPTNPRLLTSLVDALVKCGDLDTAADVFNRCSSKSTEIYGAMMKGCIINNQPSKAIDLFRQIDKPDDVIFTLLFNACAQLGTPDALVLVKEAWSDVLRSTTTNPRLLTSLIDALVRCGDLDTAADVFNRCPSKSKEIYGAIMKGYITNNQPLKAIDLFREIKEPDDVILITLFNACAQLGTGEALSLVRSVLAKNKDMSSENLFLMHSLLDAYIKCHDLDAAEKLFRKIPKNAIAYASLMSGFLNEEQPRKVLGLFDEMQKLSVELTEGGCLCLIKALSQIGSIELAKSMVVHVPPVFLNNLFVQTALVDMWGRVGLISSAKQVFQQIKEPNHVAFSAMINAYGLNGMGTEALNLLNRMPPQLITEITYICVLNACSHSGFVDQARTIFRSIPNKTPIIYTTLIDCLSRVSLFDEAQQIIEEFERDQPPSPIMYMALLSGARTRNQSQLAEQVISRIKKLFPKNDQLLTSASVLLANIFGSLGETAKAANIYNRLNRSGAKKKVGISWTYVDGQISTFRAHDQSHPRSVEIYEEVKKISEELIAHGHIYDSSWITRSLNEDETVESVLCGHSEKLAIAWNFVADPNRKRIQIVKNLRVCGDCHRATKLIARIRKCEIIVRDANRIHHFTMDGQCSCGDHF